MELLTLLHLIVGIFVVLYLLGTYALALEVVRESWDAGEYENNTYDLWFDIFVTVIAPVSIPIILAYEKWG
jgi:hypothetical protein